MEVALYTVALLCSIVGVLGSFLPILPGPAISVAALAMGYFSPAKIVSGHELLIWIAICAVITLLDLYLPVYLTKRLGGSKSGTTGATIGMIVGLIAFPPFGIIVGPFIGAVMGELRNDREDVGRAFSIGFGTFLAFFVGTGLKFIATLWIMWIMIQSIFPLIEAQFSSIIDKIALF